MSRLEQLYQETILAHNKKPRHFGVLTDPSHQAHGKNPLCGDDYMIYIKMDGDVVSDFSFSGSGCAISKSSGSLMATEIIGKTKEEVLAKKDAFLSLLISDHDLAQDQAKLLGKLKVFEGVKKYPVRVKCATLVWRALEAALETGDTEITTE